MIDGCKHRTPLPDFPFLAAREVLYSSSQSILPVTTEHKQQENTDFKN